MNAGAMIRAELFVSRKRESDCSWSYSISSSACSICLLVPVLGYRRVTKAEFLGFSAMKPI